MRISDWSSDVCSSDLLEGVKVGDPSDPEVYMGPLISEAQREKVHGMVERAVAAGATLVMGGHPIEGPGYFYAPTLLTNVDPASEVAQDELFGPVLVVIDYVDGYAAVARANNSTFGPPGGDPDRKSSVW